MLKKALVFSGQGSHRPGMSMNLVNGKSTRLLWNQMKDCMMQNYGICLQEVISENPRKIFVRSDALNIIGDVHSKEGPIKGIQNVSESMERTLPISCPNGVLSLTFLTQPCVLAAQLLALESLKENNGLSIEEFSMIAGHSLGEFTALCALGVFSPETALNLTYQRGLIMHQAVEAFGWDRFTMYACNPLRAKLHENPETADDIFFVLIELITQSLAHTTSFVEVANYNMLRQQYVVGGDSVALAILGKCLDPQFRVNCAKNTSIESIVQEAIASVKIDEKEGINDNPNALRNADFVTSATKKYGTKATYRRFMKGPDDGFTPAPDQLTHLTLEENGRSGLKRKSWFTPLPVQVPFHTSILRQCTDPFLSIVQKSLPDEHQLRKILSVSDRGKHPLWVTNLTGNSFMPFDKQFQSDVTSSIASLNIGEIRHHGKQASTLALKTFEKGLQNDSISDMVSAILSCQLSHPVMWIDVMEEVVLRGNCREIVEIAPVRTVSEMFKRSTFVLEDSKERVNLMTMSYPSDKL